jgi:acetyl esterase
LILFNPVIDNGPGGYGHRLVEQYWQDFSPLHNIPTNPPPTLFITGDNDSFLPIETSRKFKAEMEKQGGRCDLVVLEGGKHGSPFENQFFPKTLQAIDNFLAGLGYLTPPMSN